MVITKNETIISAVEYAADNNLNLPYDDIDQGSLQIVYAPITAGVKTFKDTTTYPLTDSITVTAHGYATGLKVALTTAGTLPAGLSATNYWMIRVNANTLQFATSMANALAGTAVDITDAGGAANNTLTPAAIGAVVFTIQVSNDGSNWFTTALTKTYAGAANYVFYLTDVYSKFVRLNTTIAAGQIALTAKLFGKKF